MYLRFKHCYFGLKQKLFYNYWCFEFNDVSLMSWESYVLEFWNIKIAKGLWQFGREWIKNRKQSRKRYGTDTMSIRYNTMNQTSGPGRQEGQQAPAVFEQHYRLQYCGYHYLDVCHHSTDDCSPCWRFHRQSNFSRLGSSQL